MSAAQIFNRIGQVGLGIALVGGVVNSALYNGMTMRSDFLYYVLIQISAIYFVLWYI